MVRNLLILVTISLLSGWGCDTVDTGYRGVKTEFGKVVGEPLAEGLYWYNPFTTNIVHMEVREQKIEGAIDCFTRDTQRVTIGFAMTYYPDPVVIHNTYKQFGMGWDEKIVRPATLGSIKDVVGQYVADDLVAKREEAKISAETELMENLKKRNVYVTRLDFTNLDFDDNYEAAVESKVVAVQKAAEAKNKTVEVEEQAKQQIISAKAEAESMRIRSQALSQNKSLVEYEAVQKWDGKLPQYTLGGAMPFISVGGK